MNSTPQLAVIVVSYNTRDLLLDCIQSVIESLATISAEIVVVDNNSSDGSADAVQLLPDVTVIRNQSNLGFGVACNQAIRATTAPLVLLLNSDARITPDSLAALLDVLSQNARCGAVGGVTIDATGETIRNTWNFLNAFNQAAELVGVHAPNSRWLNRSYEPLLDENGIDCNVDWIDGACLMLRRSAITEIGVFDERFFMYSEDEDLCFRLRSKGWTICFTTKSRAVHHGAASSSQHRLEMLRQFYLSQILFLRKHRSATSVCIFLAAMSMAFRVKQLLAKLMGNEVKGQDLAERYHALKSASASRIPHDSSRRLP